MLRGEPVWVLNIRNAGKRWRKYFKTFVEAKNFDVIEFLSDKQK